MRAWVGGLLLLTAGCGGDGRTDARLTSYSLTSPTTLMVATDGCRLDPTVDDLRESPEEVRLLVRRDRASGFGQSSCEDVVEVELREPLGGRNVVNAATGAAVKVDGG